MGSLMQMLIVLNTCARLPLMYLHAHAFFDALEQLFRSEHMYANYNPRLNGEIIELVVLTALLVASTQIKLMRFAEYTITLLCWLAILPAAVAALVGLFGLSVSLCYTVIMLACLAAAASSQIVQRMND